MVQPYSRSWKSWLIAAFIISSGLLAFYLYSKPKTVDGFVVEKRPVVQRVIASGVVQSDAITQIGSELTATVKKRHVREGDSVRQGQLLLELNDEREQAQLKQAQAALTEAINRQRPQATATLAEAELTLTQAQTELTRRQQLFTRDLVAKEQLDQATLKVTSARTARDNAKTALAALTEEGSVFTQLKAQVTEAQASLSKTKILSPIDGIVLTRGVEDGDQVQAGRTLLTLAQAGTSEIRVPVDEKLIAPLKLNQPVTLIADAYPDRPIKGQISFMAPNVDTNRGSLDVHIRLVEPAEFLRQGMTVTADIETARLSEALVVSNDLLFERSTSKASILVANQGRAEKRVVELGLQTDTQSVISAGLAAGDVVLTTDATEGENIRVNRQLSSLSVAQ